jgi:dihydrofolate reductase
MPKFVVSTTLTEPAWSNTTVLSGDLRTDVEKLKERFDGDILVAGSAQLVRSLLAEGLVDELRLMVFPVVLGAGRRLFADEAGRLDFELADTHRSADVAIITLRRR